MDARRARAKALGFGVEGRAVVGDRDASMCRITPPSQPRLSPRRPSSHVSYMRANAPIAQAGQPVAARIIHLESRP